jgi:hypothetical protein
MKGAIMQPTYLPWMGYFGMMDLADIFVFYDDVQFEKRSWQQRNKIVMPPGSCIWLSVPVSHHQEVSIKDVRISHETDWQDKHWKSIYHAYNRASYFKDYQEVLGKIYQTHWDYLSDLNINIIQTLAINFNIKMPKIIRSSLMEGIIGQKTDRLINIMRSLNADQYICPPGSRDYLQGEKFKDAGIELYWYEYNHPVYPQHCGEFIKYLSAIDLLFNTGKQAVNYIRQGEIDALKLEKY